MNKYKLEFFVGLFAAIGIACAAFLSICIARNELFAANGYEVQAVFSNCSGLRKGSGIMIAGVEVGRVKKIALKDYEARVTLQIERDVAIQQDAIASIKTKGLIGEKYVEISPGAADRKIEPHGTIVNTESGADIESLISKFVHGDVSKPANP